MVTIISRPGRVFASLLLLASAAQAAPSPALSNDPPKLRLGAVQSVNPATYRADLVLDPEKDTFTGSLTIHADVQKPTPLIWLNQETLTVQTISLVSGGKTMSGKPVDGGEDYVGLQFDSPIPIGPVDIHIAYSGKVNSKGSSGIFRQQDNGNWYIFTQFEPTDARAAFPCFDEPSYKTPWQLTLHIPAQSSAISNTLPASEKVEGASKTVTFRETKPLPSYLVAFGVGPFEYVDGGKTGKNKVPVRIVVPKGHSAEAKYAAEVTATIIDHHEKYFGVPYPYDKADQVSIPDTSGFGAMENPGMVTYAQNIILAKPENDSINRQRGYAEVAAHELAHQWFGDLVTTAWWNDIWLNEAFATWMEQKFTAEWKPEWNTRIGDVASKLYAEGEDSLITARKVRQPIEVKGDINNAFDGITYQKGAAVIGMFESWMGAKEFQKGVQSYMKQYAFKATTAGDFLDSLSTSSKKDVTTSFSTFLNQAGVPLVSVALDCKQNAPTLHVEQTRFLPLGSKGSGDQVWSIPFCIRYGSGDTGQSQCTLITQSAQDVPLKASTCPTWVQANDNAVGYYRVEYKGDLLASLTQGGDKHLSAPERVDLMGNAEALSSAGKLSAADALSLVEKFHADPERQVLTSAIAVALSPREHLVSEDLEPNYRRFLLKNFQARAHELGWTAKPGESDEVRLLRPSVLSAVATYGGDQELADQAKALTEKWFQDPKAIDPNMVPSTLRATAFYGDKALFERFLAKLKNTGDKQVRRQIIGAMGSFRDPAALEAGKHAIISGDIPFMEGDSLLFSGQQQEATRTLAFHFLKDNFDQVASKMPTGGGFDFGSILPRVGQSFCDARSKAELESYFKPLVDKYLGAPRALNQTLEGIDLCIAQVQAQKPSVTAFLQRY